MTACGEMSPANFDPLVKKPVVAENIGQSASFSSTVKMFWYVVRVICSAGVQEIHGDGDQVTGVSYQDRGSEAVHRVELEGVFVQIGLVPNSAWLPESVEVTQMGEIKIDPRGRTSAPGVFAAGDVTDVPYKQIVVATGEGAKAALSAFDFLIRGGLDGASTGEHAA